MPPQMRALLTSYDQIPDVGVVTIAEAGQAGDGEVDRSGAEEPGDDMSAGRGDARVGARVLGVVRCRWEQRRPRRVPDGCVVAVGVAGADGGDRPPERVGVLGVEAGDEGVGVGDRAHRHEPCGVDDVEVVVDHEPAERASGLLDGWFGPEPGGQRLLGGAGRLVVEPIALTSL